MTWPIVSAVFTPMTPGAALIEPEFGVLPRGGAIGVIHEAQRPVGAVVAARQLPPSFALLPA